MSDAKIGAGALSAAARGGLKDLQEVVLKAFPDSMNTVTEPGAFGTVVPQEVYQERHGVHGPEMGNPEMPEPAAPEPPAQAEPKMEPMPSMPMPEPDLDKE